MRTISAMSVLLLLGISAAPIGAGNIRESDYPVQYEVMNTGKTGSMLEKYCSMTLRDPAKPNVAVTVQKKGYGSCHVPDNGKTFRGRENEKKNEIELVIPVGKSKARVEDWQIAGVVDINPK